MFLALLQYCTCLFSAKHSHASRKFYYTCWSIQKSIKDHLLPSFGHIENNESPFPSINSIFLVSFTFFFSYLLLAFLYLSFSTLFPFRSPFCVLTLVVLTRLIFYYILQFTAGQLCAFAFSSQLSIHHVDSATAGLSILVQWWFSTTFYVVLHPIL